MAPKAKAPADTDIFDQPNATDPNVADQPIVNVDPNTDPNANDLQPPRLTDLLANPTHEAVDQSIVNADPDASDLQSPPSANLLTELPYEIPLDVAIGLTAVGLTQHKHEMYNMPDDASDAGDDDGDFFINMAKADEKLQPMAIGTRLVVSCTGAEAKFSTTGNPMIAVRVKVERVVSTPVTTTDTRAYKNRTVRDNLLFISPNDETGYRGTIWRANAAMRAFGVEPDHGVYRKKSEFLTMLQQKAEELVGAVAEVELGVDDGTKDGTQAPTLDPATGEPYPPKNTIVRYYPYKPIAPTNSAMDSDLPF